MRRPEKHTNQTDLLAMTRTELDRKTYDYFGECLGGVLLILGMFALCAFIRAF